VLAARARRPELLLDPLAPELDRIPAMPRDEAADWQVVRMFLHKLDDRMQRIAVMHWVDEMTQDEIAAETGWSRQTVCKKLKQLRERAARLAVRLRGQESWA
jgi:RNA polymerase sigma factor (sigma-70 family)